jgi:hypothetical protein
MRPLNQLINNSIGFFFGCTTLIGGLIGFGKIIYSFYLIRIGELEFELSSFIVVVVVSVVITLLGYVILRASLKK